jgi:hypothetical protein
MKRWLLLVLVVYAPHLLEEHLTGMWNDPLIARALEPVAALPAREAAYATFQAMLIVALVMTYAFSRGGLARRAVLGSLAVALVCEAHHLVRAAATLSYNSGLLTALPMPILGGFLLWKLVARPNQAPKVVAC